MSFEFFILKCYTLLIAGVGLSQVIHARLWSELLAPLGQRPATCLLAGTSTFVAGVIVVLGHNVWVTALPVVLTVYGWLMMLKGLGILLNPAAFAKTIAQAKDFPRMLRMAGVSALVIAALLSYPAFFYRL